MKKVGKFRKLLFVVMILLIGVSSCKTKQKITSIDDDVKKETDITVAKPVKPAKPQITYLDYEWLSYRANVSIMDYNSKKEVISGSAFFVNRKDSIIYINISKIIEIIRVVITPDSVKYINNFDNTYYRGDYSFISKMIGFDVNFNMLQSILLGEDIRGLNSNIISQQTKIENNKLVENNITENKTQKSLSIKYGDFALIDASQLFFQQMELSIPSEKILLNINTSGIKINVAGPTSIKIPDKYKAINVK